MKPCNGPLILSRLLYHPYYQRLLLTASPDCPSRSTFGHTIFLTAQLVRIQNNFAYAHLVNSRTDVSQQKGLTWARKMNIIENESQ